MFSSITNHQEQLVFEELQDILIERGEPVDPDFMEDLACIALNRLPPRYIRHKVDLVASLTDLEMEELKSRVALAVNESIDIAKRRSTAHQG